jgi:endonuclease/exonuclease/phosphatase family metal-dependent hydrolase
VLVRSWNLFHGNTSPPRRRAYLEEMVRLVTADEPDVVCLQEVPVWGLSRLQGWSGMRVLSAVARKPRLPLGLGHAVTALHTGFFRSLFTGQANALLVRRELGVLLESILVLNDASLLGIGTGERRVGQIARLERPGGAHLLLCNLHASNSAQHAVEQVERAARHVLELAEPEEPVVLAGDFNVTPDLRHLGFTEGGPGIDHILVRGDEPGPLHVWPDERRSKDGMLLSDHAPVDRTIS